MKHWLLIIEGDVEPRLALCDNPAQRDSLAIAHRIGDPGMRDGLYQVDLNGEELEVSSFPSDLADNHKYALVGPDGIRDRPEPYDTQDEAERAKDAFVGRFRAQGYYKTAGGKRIPLDELRGLLEVVMVPQEDHDDGTTESLT
jgi:hypothetical protein